MVAIRGGVTCVYEIKFSYIFRLGQEVCGSTPGPFRTIRRLNVRAGRVLSHHHSLRADESDFARGNAAHHGDTFGGQGVRRGHPRASIGENARAFGSHEIDAVCFETGGCWGMDFEGSRRVVVCGVFL